MDCKLCERDRFPNEESAYWIPPEESVSKKICFCPKFNLLCPGRVIAAIKTELGYTLKVEAGNSVYPFLVPRVCHLFICPYAWSR